MELSKEHKQELDNLLTEFKEQYKNIDNYTEEEVEIAANKLFNKTREISEKYLVPPEPIDPTRKIIGYNTETFEPVYKTLNV